MFIIHARASERMRSARGGGERGEAGHSADAAPGCTCVRYRLWRELGAAESGVNMEELLAECVVSAGPAREGAGMYSCTRCPMT